MCKPAVTHLPVVSDGPCSFSIRAYSNACAAFSLGWSWRASVAKGPPQITFQDATDAAVIGFNGATKYLNDLWRDRVYGSADTDSDVIVPIGDIS